ncbi:LysR family transcriptional regulator [Shimwellia pseudoproteus]|uniref:LysR family transcriptional regulator n=1 Tax=Shimwellia pseudoproteus TaxID=570012 RepID=UPI0018EC2FDF|nr:LysR family transcriptional regulator [Shimwellia pseudoproteus]MBJ3814568.1 LysR family transcriptional regulator [Shimwellia pseudoproteus]
MANQNLNDLNAFLVVAREKSFTKAAAQLGVSQSSLSHTMRNLETRLGVRLLTRTTRSVQTTDAGLHLLQSVGPRLDEVNEELTALTKFRDCPAGAIRITADEHAANRILWPLLEPFARQYPDISVEVIIEPGFTDIVAQRFDAGVRLSGTVEQDMIAIPLTNSWRPAVVASPDYLAKYGTPQTPQDLSAHRCINMRLATHGGLYAWEFERAGQKSRVRVEGQMTFNSVSMIVKGALNGFGIAYLPECEVQQYLFDGRLVQLLKAWSEPSPGYQLYYPSRRQNTPAFERLLQAIKSRL